MLKPRMIVVASTLLVAGCATPVVAPDPYETGNLPDQVVAMAAPGQDLSTARLRQEDGCYWYEHNGPVERTLLPLRTAGGSQICTSRTTV